MSLEKKLPFYLANSRFVQQDLFFILHNHCQTRRKLTQVHSRIAIHGFTRKNFILVKLLALYSGFNNVDIAQKLFDQVPNPSCSLWNQIIRGHSVAGNPRISVELFNKMGHSGVHPDGYTYTYVTNGCTRGGLLEEGEQVHGKILKCGIRSNVYVCTSLVDFYVKNGVLEKGSRVFDEMSEKNVVTWNTLLLGFFRQGDVDGARRFFLDMPSRSIVSWTTMIAGCAQNGRSQEALTLFRQMQQEGMEFDQVALVGILSACSDLGHLTLGRWIHSYVIQNFTPRNQPLLISLQNSLIHMYASCGEITSAFEIFMAMRQRTTVSWTSMITGFAKHGYGDEALAMFQWMGSAEERTIKPDEITFLGVLCACSHSGYVEKGRQYFHNMTHEWGIHPKIEHFGCMVDLYSRAGLLDEAHELVKSMPMNPNDIIWGALLGGCRIHRSVELASHVADCLLKEVDPDCSAGYLVLLSNVYAASMKWHDVVALREKMLSSANTRKPPGRSWIHLGESVYEFVAADRRSGETSQIYRILDAITMETRYLGDCNPYID